MNISILLPYKENYANKGAGAVSLFVNDIVRESIYRKTITIYGNTKYKKYLSLNYKNIKFKKYLSLNYKNIKFNKNFLQSSNYEYVESFIKFSGVANSDLIEVHNRPKYINQIRKKYSNKIFLYFHNDPLAMNGSKTSLERVQLLNIVDKLIFNSKWCRDRFFINLKKKK